MLENLSWDRCELEEKIRAIISAKSGRSATGRAQEIIDLVEPAVREMLFDHIEHEWMRRKILDRTWTAEDVQKTIMEMKETAPKL